MVSGESTVSLSGASPQNDNVTPVALPPAFEQKRTAWIGQHHKCFSGPGSIFPSDDVSLKGPPAND